MTKNDKLNFQKNLITQLLNDKDESEENEYLQAFRSLFYGDFIDFAKAYDALVDEKQMILKLQNIEKELKNTTLRSEIYKKNIIAVVGGFNSGKSAFISSFFADKTLSLPLSSKPSTAIATFVLAGEKTKLVGVSSNGNRVDLSELDPQIHSKISHDFIKGFGFKLKKIMPFMVLQAPLIKNCEHLCFIDTPGYGSTQDDEKSAKEFLNDTNALILLKGANNGATLQEDDEKFLKSLDLSGKKLFVMLTKAELESEPEKIINYIVGQLDDWKIDFEGVSACYVTEEGLKIVFSYPKKLTLYEFLENFLGTKKEVTKSQRDLMIKLDEVYETYAKAMKDDLERNKNSRSSKLDGIIDNITNITNPNKKDESILKLDSIISQMKVVVDELFGKRLDMPLSNSIQKNENKKNTKETKMIHPKPFIATCSKCSAVKFIAPKNDALSLDEITPHCEKCGESMQAGVNALVSLAKSIFKPKK